MLTPFEIEQLTNQAECVIHHHARLPLDQLSLTELESASPIKVVSAATYSLTAEDEQISIAQTCTVTLPPAKNNKEYHVTLTAAGAILTVLPTSPDTVMGDSLLVVTTQWTSLHFKATKTNNWVLT